jgi:gamma-glutamyltranspeptidase / glutathione hydrolase
MLPGARAESKETTHLTVIDSKGNVVALTQTVNLEFGSGVVVPKTGVLLNNQMDDFSSAPGAPNSYDLVGGEANSIAPGKIPLSSMTPTIVLRNDQVRLAVGSIGGSKIITTVLQIIINVIDRDMDIASAVAAPRIHMQWLPDETRVEPNALPERIRRELVTLGHRLVEQEAWGNATAIEVLPDGTRIGAADPRGDGGGDAQ